MLNEVIVKAWPLLLGTALYLMQAAMFVPQKNFGMAVAFAGYAIANCGLIYAAVKMVG